MLGPKSNGSITAPLNVKQSLTLQKERVIDILFTRDRYSIKPNEAYYLVIIGNKHPIRVTTHDNVPDNLKHPWNYLSVYDLQNNFQKDMHNVKPEQLFKSLKDAEAFAVQMYEELTSIYRSQCEDLPSLLEFSVNHDLINNICARNIYIEQTKKLLGLTIKPRR